MKKLLSLILSLAIMLGLFSALPLTAYSEGSYPLIVPQIIVTTEDGNGTTLQKADGNVAASITIIDVDGSTLSDSVQFKVRGNSTAMASVLKKAYNFNCTSYL